MAVAYAVVVPHRHARPTGAMYARRRVLAGILAALVVLALLLGARTALTNRGGAPASTPTVRPAAAGSAATAIGGDPRVTTTYLVRPGDSLWTLADRFHGEHSRREYLELLIDRNGGTTVLVGQQLQLP